MKRLIAIILLLSFSAAGIYLFNQYWIHRFDALIAREATAYHLDPDLVWSIIYEETYFRPWKIGGKNEVGLMQVTPVVGHEWAAETGMRDFERRMAQDARGFLRDPEHNIQVGCWYLEKLRNEFRDTPGAEARMLAGYNAGLSRAAEWNQTAEGRRPLTTEEFIARIDFPSTRAYVTSILERYRKLKAARPRNPTSQISSVAEAGR